MIWIVFAAMTAAALALILVPLWRRDERAAGRAAYDVEVYRDQLGEVGRDLARGLIEAREADAARAEIGRRLLAADAAAAPEDGSIRPTRRRVWIAGGLAIAVPVMAVLIYGFHGVPGLPGSPAAEREARAPVDRATSPEALIARLEEHLRQNPNDAEARTHLGTLLMSARRYHEAAEMFGRASALAPDNAGLLARYGEALAFAAGGAVNATAREAFEAALAIDAREPRAGFYLGMADAQAGRREAALARWRALEAAAPEDAQWRAPLRAQIARIEAELGQTPGPTAEDVEAASGMPAGDRQAMIRSMVARLADRLAEAPGDADGWIRLGRSYKVLGEKAKSREAYAKAAALRPADVAVLSSHAASIADMAGADAVREAGFNDLVARILTLDPKHPTALWFAGLRSRQSGDRDRAALHWRRLLAQMAPGSSEHAELSRHLGELETSQ